MSKPQKLFYEKLNENAFREIYHLMKLYCKFTIQVKSHPYVISCLLHVTHYEGGVHLNSLSN